MTTSTTCRSLGFAYLLLLAPALVLATARECTATGYDPQRDPAADLRAATVTAMQEHKRILLIVGGDWCSWCRLLARTLHDGDLARQIEAHFVVVKVNSSPQNLNRSFLAQYPEIVGFPHIFVLESNGRLLFSEDTSNLEKGRGYDRPKIEAFFKRWAPP